MGIYLRSAWQMYFCGHRKVAWTMLRGLITGGQFFLYYFSRKRLDWKQCMVGWCVSLNNLVRMTAVSLLNPKTWKLKFCFLRIPQLHKLVWIRGPLAWLGLRFLASSSRKLQGREQEKKGMTGEGEVVVSFSSQQHDSDQKSARLASKRVFRQNLQGRMG